MKYQQQLTSILDQTQSSQRRKIFVLLSAKLIESARYTHVACKNIFYKDTRYNFHVRMSTDLLCLKDIISRNSTVQHSLLKSLISAAK